MISSQNGCFFIISPEKKFIYAIDQAFPPYNRHANFLLFFSRKLSDGFLFQRKRIGEDGFDPRGIWIKWNVIGVGFKYPVLLNGFSRFSKTVLFDNCRFNYRWNRMDSRIQIVLRMRNWKLINFFRFKWQCWIINARRRTINGKLK